ncbi:bifunctional AP-4-A phosphorylase/ADP sulfurylase [Clydaea vesicula]|uniref:Bifunctional AP-4-A phosphorylase/ADP sulfurylase n=1 Tax=Clydaea vesicula TaxID=447962 RepID=A0AAD5U1U5_9FUNG
MFHLTKKTFESAKSNKSLIFTPTVLHIKEEDSVKFHIRLAVSLFKKPSDGLNRSLDGKKPNPFLPFDKNLFIAENAHHNFLLNKFSISPYHVLITTKEFQSQLENPDINDFQTAWDFLSQSETDSAVLNYMCFYNCG